MRDDISGLGFLRMFPEDWKPATARTPLSNVTSAFGKSPFAAQLARAAKARAATAREATTHRYASPLASRDRQRQELPQTLQRKPTLPKTATLPAQTTPRLTSSTKPQQARPALPVPKPEAPRPPAGATPSLPMSLSDYPHPNGDNGRGMHWIPTTKQSKTVVDRFVAEARKMGVKWVTFLNNAADIGQNDYLVKKLVGAGIEPIMRLYSPTLEPIKGDVEGMVRHYVAEGVHYFQPFNEPNLNIEQPDGVPSVDRYLDCWIPAAQAIVRGGGLPGFGSLSPGGDKNDVDFLSQALDGLRNRGQLGLLDKGWLSMHNYTHNHPIEERADTDGFFKFRAYHSILRSALGRDVPIIGTEGGTFIGEHEDTSLPAIDVATAVNMATQAYTYMRDQREPWNFAYSFWTIANEAGGGTDSQFRDEALFRGDGSASPIVSALQSLNSA